MNYYTLYVTHFILFFIIINIIWGILDEDLCAKVQAGGYFER